MAAEVAGPHPADEAEPVVPTIRTAVPERVGARVLGCGGLLSLGYRLASTAAEACRAASEASSPTRILRNIPTLPGGSCSIWGRSCCAYGSAASPDSLFCGLPARGVAAERSDLVGHRLATAGQAHRGTQPVVATGGARRSHLPASMPWSARPSEREQRRRPWPPEPCRAIVG
jgi:hypothetical protein